VRRSGDFHALCRACAAAFALGLPLASTGSALAQPNETLTRARLAWDKGEFDSAEPLYKEAIDRGGLSPGEMLDATVRLGASRVVLGKKKSALVAFRHAALLDPRFTVPPEAGRKAVLLANQARREQTKIGPYVLKTEIPETVPANKPFRVSASLDATHAALASRIGVAAREPVSDKSFENTVAASTTVVFEVPASLATGDQVVTVRLDALDQHDNRLVSVERHVKVNPAPPAETPVVVAPVTPPPPANTAQAKTAPDWSKPIPDTKKDAAESKKGGFWSSPWPYVIGGVALAAGGAAVYVVTRPTDDVAVGSAAVRVR
jgi:hypothetical protein